MTWDIPTSHRITSSPCPPGSPNSSILFDVAASKVLGSFAGTAKYDGLIFDGTWCFWLVLSSYPWRFVSSTISDWNKSIRYLGCFGFLFDSVFLLREFRKDRRWILDNLSFAIKYLQFRALSDQSPLSKSDLPLQIPICSRAPANRDTTSNITVKDSSLPTYVELMLWGTPEIY